MTTQRISESALSLDTGSSGTEYLLNPGHKE